MQSAFCIDHSVPGFVVYHFNYARPKLHNTALIFFLNLRVLLLPMLSNFLFHVSALNPANLGTLPTVVTEIAFLRMQGNTSQLESTNLLITRKLKEA